MKKKYGLSFSWKRAIGISGIRNSLSRKIGVPTTQSGFERMIGRKIMRLIRGK